MNNIKAHILVVDDDDGIRDLVKQVKNYLMKYFQFKKREFIKHY